MYFKRFFYFLALYSYCNMSAYAQSDGSQYPIDDPRNPNCPCHKYQKQAEEEFKQMQQKKDKNISPIQFHNDVQVINNIERNTQVDAQPLAKLGKDGNENSKVNISKPQLPHLSTGGGVASGRTYKAHSHYWKKKMFRMSKRLKKLIGNRKSQKFRLEDCFEW